MLQNGQRWEYLSLESTFNYGTTKYIVNGEQQPTLKNLPLVQVINQVGSQGWEMVGVAAVGDNRTYIFKRLTDKAYVPQAKKPTA